MIGEDCIKQWVKERNEAAYSFDPKVFRKFFQKWAGLGMYDEHMIIPPDEILEITMRKMVCSFADPDPEKLKEAQEWLRKRGYSAEMRRVPSPEEIVEELRSFAAENYYQDTLSELLMDAANTIEILEHERQQLIREAEDNDD